MLVLLGVIASTTGAALRHKPRADSTQTLEQIRRQAIRSGQPATTHDSLARSIRFLPDGRAVGPGVDPLTGRVRGTR